jgi:hypothetical protein
MKGKRFLEKSVETIGARTFSAFFSLFWETIAS